MKKEREGFDKLSPNRVQGEPNGVWDLVKLNKIYTRTGDSGTTGLVDGSRVSKADPRMALIGDVDEANSALGVAIAALGDDPIVRDLTRIQNDLFDLGADFATPGEDFAPSEMTLRIVPAQVERLEREIDAMNEGLAPLRSFILPGGTPGVAALHLARAVVRRAERTAVGAATEIVLNPAALAYLNRLSDHLFVAARAVAAQQGGDVLWVPGASRS
ncbi:putative ATP--cob(I)alamin adenosyltransferase [Sphingomonas changbaiensis NBRC 104936]|uniref:Corrinoid adenosyltransferase n=1 Tax=Sphingomonas changbaiensis NBRC 104936 TaxID=1219043 RepID=A0A0E9MSE1_9SPHN|nr:putative ATP--cob(I)alamin adenosyltransferase [Sphingomonas changbaiensis NBRC 104936]